MKPKLFFTFSLVQFRTKVIRVLYRAARGYQRNSCALRASALSLYTLFSIVPVMAMAFGIAKGFGFQQFLEAEVLSLFEGREEIVQSILVFSNNLLEKTQGGLMAVLGVLLLLYSLIKLMFHIEGTFNLIWWVRDGRPLIRKLTDYLTIALAAGLLGILSGSVNLFMIPRLESFWAYLGVPIDIKGIISFFFSVVPYVVTWSLFMFFYMIMPHKKVDFRAAGVGAVFAGTLFQVIQTTFLKFQVFVTGYNAIYGSFSALPMFLIWLQISWGVLLYGAEISFEWENTENAKTPDLTLNAMSIRARKLAMLEIVKGCVQRFAEKKPPATDVIIARELNLPLTIVHYLLESLMSAGILYSVRLDGNTTGYTPAMDIECLSIMDVLCALEHQGDAKAYMPGTLLTQALEDSLETFDRAARTSNGERLIKDI
ncbi:YihY/virulence factor BrkB family protein [uncultured Desulfobacter sp.]|uniref:YihY/virulence factor BrkB family protein n=1 Tax=uncultured Desulfobacter sp. TaxID=240139 RepID=UPI002AAB2AA5|nr:YihY/virulence factor BrkB family protein [uncultured Desulfobacter sp.]